MRAMSLSIRSEPYDFFVMRLGLNSTKRCSPGLPGYATAMGSGRNIGTTTWQDRHRSSLTNHGKEMFRTISAKPMSAVAIVMTGCINTGFINLEATNPGMIDRFGFVSVSWFPGFLINLLRASEI